MAWSSTDFERSSMQSSKPALALDHVQAPWTAARCQRLLRPLASKIVLLRKEKQRTSNLAEAQQAHGPFLDPMVANSHERTSEQGGRRRTSGATNFADEEWAPNPRPSKRIKRTYSSRSLTSQRPGDSSQHSTADQRSQTSTEITIPSAFFQPEAQRDAEVDAVDLSQHIEAHEEDALRQSEPRAQRSEGHSQYLWQEPPRSKYKVRLPFEAKLTDGILKGMGTILRATGRPKPSRGARELFTTCLRKMPDYIAEEERRYTTEDPEGDVDVSSMVYSDLESLGTSDVGGWEPLRQVVRAHGISMVGTAVREGLVGVRVACQMVVLCHSLGTCNEAQYIFHCLIGSIELGRNSSKVPKRLVSS